MPGCLPGTLYSPSTAGQMVKPTSPSVLWECEEKHKPPWLIALKTFSYDSERRLGQKTHLVYLKIPLSYHCARIWNWQPHRCRRCFRGCCGYTLTVFSTGQVLKLSNTSWKHVNLCAHDVLHLMTFPHTARFVEWNGKQKHHEAIPFWIFQTFRRLHT